MTPHSLDIDLDGTWAHLPLFQRIARHVVRDIQRGRLKKGALLPSSRALATQLGVHRNTILAAYHELEREGYIETRPARGTFITGDLPEASNRDKLSPKRRLVPLALPPLVPRGHVTRVPKEATTLTGSLSDLALLPSERIARAYRRVLRHGVVQEGTRWPSSKILDYADERGPERLRLALTQLLQEDRGLQVAEGELLITRGSQMGLYLAAQAALKPGARIAVEAMGYRPAWEAFRLGGARLVPIQVDADGLNVDRVEQLASQGKIEAVYLTPHHQYPTTVTLSGRRRLALLRTAARYGVVLIEDDYDHEFHFDGRPLLPLCSTDEAGVVIYVGTLSKVLAPGLRIGYTVARPEIITRMARLRSYIDRQGDSLGELAVATLMEEGEVSAHVRRLHRIYARRREHMFCALDTHAKDLLTYERPKGGLTVWARIRRGGPKADDWANAALRQGIWTQPGSLHCFHGRAHQRLRLGFGRVDAEAISPAVKRFAEIGRELAR